MAYSLETTIATGSSAVVNVPFPYLAREHVHVMLDGEVVEDGDLSWLSNSQIELPETPAAGVAVRVYRQTPATGPLVSWPGANVLDHRDLNLAVFQNLYIAQEAIDGSSISQEAAEQLLQWIDQVEDTLADAAAMSQAATLAAAGAGAAKTAAETAQEAAELAAASAEADASTASGAASTATGAASTATQAASDAEGFAADAEEAAGLIDGVVTAAQEAASNAADSAAAAAISETNAGLSAASASADAQAVFEALDSLASGVASVNGKTGAVTITASDLGLDDALTSGAADAELADSLTLTSEDDGADQAPLLNLVRSSATPAAGDLLGGVRAVGMNDAAEQTVYGQWVWKIVSAADGVERARADLELVSSGYATNILGVGYDSTMTLYRSDNSAAAGPLSILGRYSGSPAAGDLLGEQRFTGWNSAASEKVYGWIGSRIVDPTSGSEDGRTDFGTVSGGTEAIRGYFGAGFVVGTPTGGDKGGGSINAASYYINGVLLEPGADPSITITGGGLATGGGSLAANRVITVTEASQAEAEAGTAANVVMTPRRVKQAIEALAGSGGQPIPSAWNDFDVGTLLLLKPSGTVNNNATTAGSNLRMPMGGGGDPTLSGTWKNVSGSTTTSSTTSYYYFVRTA